MNFCTGLLKKIIIILHRKTSSLLAQGNFLERKKGVVFLAFHFLSLTNTKMFSYGSQGIEVE